MLITFPSKKRFGLVVVDVLPCLPAFVGLLNDHAKSAGKTRRYWLSEIVKLGEVSIFVLKEHRMGMTNYISALSSASTGGIMKHASYVMGI